ncbi:piggyBac transposable element-derived protein 3-like [Sphaeramia orbicularis]|uniref:piggyBac transposable element-derived protein 3-like n=1 Tax=Sphaeramia orbicularis TaxID=375764 RepID=UPI0011809C1E|nr:piggyBac transposable element-derived protein 3-like [Sphaeramia orbicularis]
MIQNGDESVIEGFGDTSSDREVPQPVGEISQPEGEVSQPGEAPQPSTSTNKHPLGQEKFTWRKKPSEAPDCTFKGESVIPPDVLPTPLQYFRRFITEEMIESMMVQTNLYSVQTSGTLKNVSTTVKELEILNGMYLRMGLCQLPGNRAYWENDTRCAMVADNMSRNRFQTLLTSLHFVDNMDLSNRQEGDKCWKICPWLDRFRKQCLEITPEEYNSIDEQMVSFRGTRSPIRQYVKSKPHPWGFKIWARCTSTGILCDFQVYEGGTGKRTTLGMGGDVALKLCETLPPGQNYKVFADNLFSSAALVHQLLQQQIFYTGTLRSNRLSGCLLEDDKSLAKRVEPQDKARRWSEQEKAFLDINQPHVVKEYNTFMGGVDLNDGCIARYKYNMRSRRWYIYLFWHSIMLALVNAWLTYRRDCKLLGERPLNQRRFQAEVAASLILIQAKRGRPSLDSNTTPQPATPKRVRVRVPDDVHLDQVAHWPVKCAKRGRCTVCKQNATTTLCQKCDVRLCFTEERNCFKAHHFA